MSMKIKSGIYKITNKINNKIYIGSSCNIKNRWKSHLSDLRNNKHANVHLQNAWNKYGEENFLFEVIEVVTDLDKLIEREQYWIDASNCVDKNIGYNLSPTAGSCLGVKHSDETKEKFSKMRIGELNSKAKINEKTAKIIKYLTLFTNVRLSDISNYFRLDECSVFDIKKGKNWKHIKVDSNFLSEEETYILLNTILEFNKQPTIKDIIDVKLLLTYSILNQREIAKLYNIDKNLIYKIAIEEYRFNPSIMSYKSLPYYLEELSYQIIMNRKIATINDTFRKIIVYFMKKTNLSTKELGKIFNVKRSALNYIGSHFGKEYIKGYSLPLFYQKLLEELKNGNYSSTIN